MKIQSNKKRKTTVEHIEYGTVEKISIQGNIIYAVVRSEGIYYYDEVGTIKVKDTFLFGSNGVPEQYLLLADVLLPTDIIPGNNNIDYSYYIGKKVEVILNEDTPRIVLLSRINSSIPSRGIPIEDISDARAMSGGRDLNDLSKTYLNKLGYSKEQIDVILQEKYSEIINKENILTYSDEQQWDINIKKDKNSNLYEYTNQSLINNVAGLTGKKTKNKTCYIPILAIGGKK